MAIQAITVLSLFIIYTLTYLFIHPLNGKFYVVLKLCIGETTCHQLSWSSKRFSSDISCRHHDSSQPPNRVRPPVSKFILPHHLQSPL